jgi:hypothetical protein
MTTYDHLDADERRWIEATRRRARQRQAVLAAAVAVVVLLPALAVLSWRARRAR